MDRIIRGANWYVEELNLRMRFDTATLPRLSREMLPMVMGWFNVEMPGGINPLSSEITLKSAHEDIRSRFGREPGDWTTCYYYESLLDIFPSGQASGQNGGEEGVIGSGRPNLHGRVVIMKGLLNDLTPPGVQGMKPSAPTKAQWSSIVLYHDVFDGRTVHKFDVQRNTLIIDGVNYTAEHNRMIAA